jgi:hypothetical protein
MEGDDDAF